MPPIFIITAAAGALFLFSRKKGKGARPFAADCTLTSDAAALAAARRIALPLFRPHVKTYAAIKDDPFAQETAFKLHWLQVTLATLQVVDRQMGGKLSESCPNGSPDVQKFGGIIACEMMRTLVKAGAIDEENDDIEAACADPGAVARRLIGQLDGATLGFQ